jgi:hypothetical protein
LFPINDDLIATSNRRLFNSKSVETNKDPDRLYYDEKNERPGKQHLLTNLNQQLSCLVDLTFKTRLETYSKGLNVFKNSKFVLFFGREQGGLERTLLQVKKSKKSKIEMPKKSFLLYFFLTIFSCFSIVSTKIHVKVISSALFLGHPNCINLKKTESIKPKELTKNQIPRFKMLPVIFKALFFSCDNHGFLSAGYFSKIDICSRNPIIIFKKMSAS